MKQSQGRLWWIVLWTRQEVQSLKSILTMKYLLGDEVKISSNSIRSNQQRAVQKKCIKWMEYLITFPTTYCITVIDYVFATTAIFFSWSLSFDKALEQGWYKWSSSLVLHLNTSLTIHRATRKQLPTNLESIVGSHTYAPMWWGLLPLLKFSCWTNIKWPIRLQVMHMNSKTCLGVAP